MEIFLAQKKFNKQRRINKTEGKYHAKQTYQKDRRQKIKPDQGKNHKIKSTWEMKFLRQSQINRNLKIGFNFIDIICWDVCIGLIHDVLQTNKIVVSKHSLSKIRIEWTQTGVRRAINVHQPFTQPDRFWGIPRMKNLKKLWFRIQMKNKSIVCHWKWNIQIGYHWESTPNSFCHLSSMSVDDNHVNFRTQIGHNLKFWLLKNSFAAEISSGTGFIMHSQSLHAFIPQILLICRMQILTIKSITLNWNWLAGALFFCRFLTSSTFLFSEMITSRSSWRIEIGVAISSFTISTPQRNILATSLK